ncbi:hypothetical protein GCM10022225_72840 [Plantactinospora mayteni]|uniref:Uncharacterized protein n=1 Tax=Plantactinospora mayteni TaxID=566021 RepID=A0ABQ4F1F1_9ACTN|nr:hypothetical protein Pma05_73110 [Plantactinospora mayteni]
MTDRVRLVRYSPGGFDPAVVANKARPTAAEQGAGSPAGEEVVPLDFLPLLKEGDSYGSRRRGFWFIADCPPGVLR